MQIKIFLFSVIIQSKADELASNEVQRIKEFLYFCLSLTFPFHVLAISFGQL